MSDAVFSDLAHRLARNFSWLSLQELVIRLLGLATAVYLARVLTAEDYGALGLALAVVNFSSVLVHAGTGSRATRLIARDPTSVPEVYGQVTGFRISMAVVVGALLIGFSGSIGPFFSLPPLLLVACSLLLLRGCLAVVWAYRGLDQMHVTALGDIVEKSLTFIGLLLLVHGHGRDYLWAPLVEVVAALLVIAWMHRRLAGMYPGLRPQFRLRGWLDIAREALPFSLAGMLASIYLSGGILLLGWLSTAAAAAMFLVAQKVMLTLALLLQVINSAAFPATSRLVQTDMATALQLSAQVLRYYLVITVPAFLVVAFHARGVLVLLFGEAYAEAASVLVLLLAALPFVAATTSLQMLLRAIPRPMAVLAARGGGAVVLVLLAVLLIPDMAATGSAIALASGETVSALLLFVFVRRATGGAPWDRRCWAPLLAGAAAALLYVAVAAWPIPLKLPLAAIVYTGGVLLLRGMTLAEIRDLARLLLAALRPGGGRATGLSREKDSGQKPG